MSHDRSGMALIATFTMGPANWKPGPAPKSTMSPFPGCSQATAQERQAAGGLHGAATVQAAAYQWDENLIECESRLAWSESNDPVEHVFHLAL